MARTSQRKWVTGYLIAVAAIFILYQFLFPWEGLPIGIYDFLQLWLPPTAVNESLVYVICALGLNIVVGYAGLLDLGYVAFWAIGGYCAGWFMSEFFYQINVHFFGSVARTAPGIHVNFWGVLLIGGLVCAFFGILIGGPTLRLKSDYLAIVTLGFGEIIPQVFFNGDNIAGFNLSNGTKGITILDPIPVGVKNIGPFDFGFKFIIFVLLAALMVFISLRLRKGKLGRAWLAIREDELAASMMGVPLMRTKLSAYAVGAFAGGLGGVAFATHVDGVYAERFNFSISIFLLAMVVLGGMGNVWGVIIGALLLSWINSTGLPAFGSTFNDKFGTSINFPSFTFLLFGLVLILMMLYKREGLIPESRLRLILHEGDAEEDITSKESK
ncbi:MAG: branched-chain amino acid ABC transporter permease [Streptomycetaceae bacterium]|nr:MAG: branched-chain amino acid ABC transporter permease [Streptomycetaceae bacterium]